MLQSTAARTSNWSAVWSLVISVTGQVTDDLLSISQFTPIASSVSEGKAEREAESGCDLQARIQLANKCRRVPRYGCRNHRVGWHQVILLTAAILTILDILFNTES